ncbi:DUF453-domain-containing protein [Pseudovirgaria hyperparasitica]|uniref:DUF453-domain-containing protein n=1 Tax=Pseudovirgaria hyperparasitica TaxID=470096 RepID=A0A6A6WKG3_9PEZI|nr:DUF453-domain-containing protein [Pseudovirgaria hyperparasitica]KAF2762643.1 DUF453-domain-containing protein [Pseudovirgaria hyperparasitica]
MRAGTSRGIFLHGDHMPQTKSAWPQILSTIMGSGNGDRRQLDGVGGATSTTSKAAIVSPSSHPDADVDFTFAQVAVGENKVDLRGSCGNICSGVGPFALDEGLVRVKPGQKQAVVRVHDTNTGALISQTLQVAPDGTFLADGTHKISGYAGSGSPLKLSWTNPSGTVGTRQFYPTGNPSDTLTFPSLSTGESTCIQASLIDAANPFVFVDAATLPTPITQSDLDSPDLHTALESTRCHAAVLFGLAHTPQDAARTRAVPKIVLCYPPSPSSHVDIRVVPFSMGSPHPSFQLTGTVALSAALTMPGTVPSLIARKARSEEPLRSPETGGRAGGMGGVKKAIAHRSGVVEAVVRNVEDASVPLGVRVADVSVVTTARRIFRGDVFV